MKKITVYKLKPDVSDIDSALDKKYQGNSRQVMVDELPEHTEAYAVFRPVGGKEKTQNDFPWLSFINSGLPIDQRFFFQATNKFPSAMIIMKFSTEPGKDNYYALAFGLAGNSFLDKEKIIRDFGIKVAMNICDPKALKRVRTNVHESISTQTERQTSAGAELTAFGINGEREFLQSIAGRTKKQDFDFIEAFHGKDSINLRFKKDDEVGWKELSDRVKKLGVAYAATDYQKIFETYDNFHSEPDPKLIKILDDLVFSKIKTGAFEHVHLAPPEFFDYDRYDFVYGHDEKKGQYPDLIIQEYITQKSRRFSDNASIKSLKSQKVSLYDAETEGLRKNKYKLYDCIVAEVDYEDSTYVLASGDWKKVSNDFLNEVNYYVENIVISPAHYLENNIRIWQSPNPGKENDKGSNREAVYNETIDNNCDDVTMFDRSRIEVAGEKKYEICDLLHSDKHFAHLKRYHNGAASISHLFSQGRFYGDAFVGDAETRQGMRAYLEEIYRDNEVQKNRFLALVPEQRGDLVTNDYTILFGILHERDEMSVTDLPFMSRYELMYAHKHLTGFGYKCEIAFRRVLCGPIVAESNSEEE